MTRSKLPAAPLVVKPWERTPNEPGRWFARFERFRLLGPARTIEATWRAECGVAKGSKGKRPSRHWYAAARAWEWQARAEAWDAHVFAEGGRACVLELMQGFAAASRETSRSLRRIRPKNWRQLLQALQLLARVIPMLRAAANGGRNARV